jgi:hypothetical protein
LKTRMLTSLYTYRKGSVKSRWIVSEQP